MFASHIFLRTSNYYINSHTKSHTFPFIFATAYSTHKYFVNVTFTLRKTPLIQYRNLHAELSTLQWTKRHYANVPGCYVYTELDIQFTVFVCFSQTERSLLLSWFRKTAYDHTYTEIEVCVPSTKYTECQMHLVIQFAQVCLSENIAKS